MTLEEFIDTSHINTLDALELKSRINALVQEEREKAIEETKSNMSYGERLANTVAKKLVDAFENLTIEDVNMYQLGYNKAIDEFAERLKIKLGSYYDHYMIDEVAEEMKGGE